MKKYWGRICIQLLLLLGGLTLISVNSTISYQYQQEITTLEPEIVLRSIVYEGDKENISGFWLTTDSQPVVGGRIAATLLVNDSSIGKIKEFEFSTDLDGNFMLDIDYTDFLKGEYIWEIKFSKLGYQGWDILLNVELIPHTFDIRIDFQPELVKGEEFFIAAIVTYASINSDKFGSGASDIEVRFTFLLLDDNDGSFTIAKLAISNQIGVALVILTTEETKSIQSVTSVIVEIEQSEQIYAAEVEAPNLPVVISRDVSFLDRIMEFLENNIVLMGFLTVFFGSSTIILLFKRNKIPLKQKMWPKHEK